MPTQISLNFIVIIAEWTPWRRYIQAETLLRLVLWNEALFEQELLRPCYLLAVKRLVSPPAAQYTLCIIVACIIVAGRLILLWLWDILRSTPRAAA